MSAAVDADFASPLAHAAIAVTIIIVTSELDSTYLNLVCADTVLGAR